MVRHYRLSRDVRQLGGRGGQIHLGSPGESGKWGRSSPTDQGRVSPSHAPRSVGQ
jgi:hypothetical protein